MLTVDERWFTARIKPPQVRIIPVADGMGEDTGRFRLESLGSAPGASLAATSPGQCGQRPPAPTIAAATRMRLTRPRADKPTVPMDGSAGCDRSTNGHVHVRTSAEASYEAGLEAQGRRQRGPRSRRRGAGRRDGTTSGDDRRVTCHRSDSIAETTTPGWRRGAGRAGGGSGGRYRPRPRALRT